MERAGRLYKKYLSLSDKKERKKLERMQNESGIPQIANEVFRAWLHSRAEKRKRAFEEHRDEVRRIHEERMEEKRVAARMEEAKQMRQFQEKLAADEAQNQLKIALFNAEMQWKLAGFNAGNQKELALFNAQVQKEIAKFNAENQMNISVNTAEMGYNLENFPLYIRSWSSKQRLEKAEYLPVKVVVIPPDEDDGKWEKCLTSQITYFMQKNFPDTYYEFLGGAWRRGRCTGQTAYNLIYAEFHEEPFLIVDCDYMEQSRLGIRTCFWYPGSPGIQVRQFIHDWNICDAMKLPEDNRDNPIQNDKYCYESMKFCADICEWIIGMTVDIYHLSIGTSQHSQILKRLPEIIGGFSEHMQKDVCSGLLRETLDEYGKLIQEEFLLDSGTRLHCTCELTDILYQLWHLKWIKLSGNRKKAEDYVKSAWEQWCRRIGVSNGELGNILRSEADSRALCAVLREDADSRGNLEKIYELHDKMTCSNHNLSCLVQKIRVEEKR